MKTYKDRESLYAALTEDFTRSAYGADKSRGKNFVLTSLKAQYIVERLNQVFGIGNWILEGEWKDADDGILYFGELQCSFLEGSEAVTIRTGVFPGFAGENSRNSGDAYKSARTDCLSKAASYFGVGNDMYKGLVEAPTDEELDNIKEEPVKEEKKASKKKVSKFQKAAKKEEQSQSEPEAKEEDAAPAQPSKLKTSRMFKRTTSKLKSKGE